MSAQNDFGRLLEAVTEAASNARRPYHLSLGALLEIAEAHPDAKVVVDGTRGLGKEHSYRGYYNELSFTPLGEPSDAAAVIRLCKRALSQEYEGYKGGEYKYDKETALWLAPYGCCGRAIIDAEYSRGVIHITTKDIG